jgi:hypothetical protein
MYLQSQVFGMRLLWYAAFVLYGNLAYYLEIFTYVCHRVLLHKYAGCRNIELSSWIL